MGGHHQRHLRLQPRQRRNHPSESRPAGQILALGQPHALGAGRRLRHLDRHQRRRRELLGGLPPEFRQISHRRGRTAGQLPRAGIRRRRRRTALDHHREIGADDLLAQNQRVAQIPEQTASRSPLRHRPRRRKAVAGFVPGALPAGPENRSGEGIQPPGRVVEPARQQNIHHLQDIGRRSARGHDARHAALRPRGRQFHAHPRLRRHVHHRHRRRHLRRPVGSHLRQRAHPLRPRGGSDRAQLHLCGGQSALAAEQQGAFGVPRQRRPHLGDDVQRGILPLRRAKRRFRGL